MKLMARLFPFGTGTQRILAAHLPASALVFTSGRCAVDVDDPALPRILGEGDAEGGFWVSGELVVSPAELRTFTHFELVTRATARETVKDAEENDAVRRRGPLIDARGHSSIRLLTGLFLSQIKLRPNMVASIGEWSAEYVVGPAAAQALLQGGYTGVSSLPINDARTRGASKDYQQLFCDALMQPAVLDRSVERISSPVADEDGRFRHLGCLTYEHAALIDRPDFNRTAEPWAGWMGWPSWVVSAKVMQGFKKAKLRGWHFRPVLTAGSAMYEQYLSNWTKLYAVVTATSRSKFDGGRW